METKAIGTLAKEEAIFKVCMHSGYWRLIAQNEEAVEVVKYIHSNHKVSVRPYRKKQATIIEMGKTKTTIIPPEPFDNYEISIKAQNRS